MTKLLKGFYLPIAGTFLLLCCNASPQRGDDASRPVAGFEPRQRPLSELMGINAIWGWGSHKSSTKFGPGEGPYLYSEVATWARSYHNLHWDVKDPDTEPDYSRMPGSLNLDWLNWDEEYKVWKDAGLEIEASIQFLDNKQPEEVWDDPYQAAYNYGFAFARHFGPTHGNGYVKRLEVGNEPWRYTAAFYQKVLSGMARGVKDADPAMKVLPAALQATNPENENRAHRKNYMPVRIPKEAVQYLDALNLHVYSYLSIRNKREATFPENPNSSFQNVVKNIDYIREHYPGKEVYVTEWGWGSDGGGDTCLPRECVSEMAQAIYAARGLFFMDGAGVDRAAWYYFQSRPGGKQIYGRCGLVSSTPSGAQKKRSFYVFKTILEQLGDEYLLDIRQQDRTGYVYVYGSKSGKPKHIVAWRPIRAEDPETSKLSVKLETSISRAYLLDGNPEGPTEVKLSSVQNGQVNLQLSAVPMVLELN